MAVFSVDPVTKTSEMMEVPAQENGSSPSAYPSEIPRYFFLHGDILFASIQFTQSESHFVKYSLRTRAWQRLKTKWPAATRFFSVHGRLLLGTPDSILEIDPETEVFKVLASARRRRATPPVSGCKEC